MSPGQLFLLPFLTLHSRQVSFLILYVSSTFIKKNMGGFISMF